MNRKVVLPAILAGLLVIVLLLWSSLFTVNQKEQAIVLQFGDPKRVVTDPGLHMKLPLLQNVEYYEKRVLNFDPQSERVILADQKPLIVDAFLRYRISDPLRFKQSVSTEANVRSRLAPILSASLRQVLGDVTLPSVLSEERADLMRDIRSIVNDKVQRFGVDVVDVRIGRADLPEKTSQAVYDRMRSERIREAAEFRAQGAEQAARIKATADREATVIRAEAKRESEILRGEGDAARTTTLNEAYGQDPEFFDFYRSMVAYKDALAREGAYMVLTPDSEFFRQFKQPEGRTLSQPLPGESAVSQEGSAAETPQQESVTAQPQSATETPQQSSVAAQPESTSETPQQSSGTEQPQGAAETSQPESAAESQ
jgi:membrane protease subunit HflC